MHRSLRAAECPVLAGGRRRAQRFDGLDDAGHAEWLATIDVEAREFDVLVMRLEELGELARVIHFGHDDRALVREERVNLGRGQWPQHARGQRMRRDALCLETVDCFTDNAERA